MFEPEEVRRWERNVAAMIRRAGHDDPEAFAEVVRILDATREQLREAAKDLAGQTIAGSGCYSWADLGRALGVTRSAAYQRFGPRH